MTGRVTVLSETLAEGHAIHQHAGRHLDDPDPKDQVQNGAEDRHTRDKPWVAGCCGAAVFRVIPRPSRRCGIVVFQHPFVD